MTTEAMARCRNCGLLSKDEAISCERGDCYISDWNVQPGRTYPRRGALHLDGWSGRTIQPVVVMAETPKRYRVMATSAEGLRVPRGRHQSVLIIYRPGTHLVPKYAVTFE